MSKTQEALALIDQGMNPHAAAKQVGLAINSVYVAIKRRRLKGEGKCGECERPLDLVERIALSLEAGGAPGSAKHVREKFGGA